MRTKLQNVALRPKRKKKSIREKLCNPLPTNAFYLFGGSYVASYPLPKRRNEILLIDAAEKGSETPPFSAVEKNV